MTAEGSHNPTKRPKSTKRVTCFFEDGKYGSDWNKAVNIGAPVKWIKGDDVLSGLGGVDLD